MIQLDSVPLREIQAFAEEATVVDPKLDVPFLESALPTNVISDSIYVTRCAEGSKKFSTLIPSDKKDYFDKMIANIRDWAKKQSDHQDIVLSCVWLQRPIYVQKEDRDCFNILAHLRDRNGNSLTFNENGLVVMPQGQTVMIRFWCDSVDNEIFTEPLQLLEG